MERFVLIDGNAIMHRAFHALPPLTKNGVQVNAVYGFFSMFLKILQDLQPTCIAVCFDKAAPTFRQQLYAGYQATRPQMADDLSPQFEIVHTMLEKIGVAIFEVDGYEADDLIGTLASQAVRKTEDRRQNTDMGKTDKTEKKLSVNSVSSGVRLPSSVVRPLEIIIVSGDRDLLQLVNSHVKMYAPITGLTNTILYDEEKVEEKFGIKPSQIIDYKALVGDASDNYPGVSGIGPKTAADLLSKYGSFENLYQHLSELPPKISEKLATDAEQASLAKKLATIDCKAPVHFDKETCSFSDESTKKLKESFAEIGFASLVKRLENGKLVTTETQNKAETQKSKDKDQQLGLL